MNTYITHKLITTDYNIHHHYYTTLHVVNINLETHIHILHLENHKSYLVLNLILQPKFLFLRNLGKLFLETNIFKDK